jgi:hypothetical protein
MTLLHSAGHRKSNVELSKGPHCRPSRPQPSFVVQYVDVQSNQDSAGVSKDWAREKNAKPIM